MKKRLFATALAIVASTTAVSAGAIEVCKFAPSNLLGATGVGAAATAVTGLGMKAFGLYAIQNGVTGAWMLGSTAAGASAAGTTGILAGTAGALGTAGAVLLSTPVIIGGAVVAAGVGVYEGGCYLASKK